jgi:hypothetical protein
VFRFEPRTYEERLTLWHAPDPDAATESARSEASDYASSLAGCVFTGLIQTYELYGEPGQGAEVFSLMRDSSLAADDYLDRFFDTGDERQRS